jgi:hypothetical protein
MCSWLKCINNNLPQKHQIYILQTRPDFRGVFVFYQLTVNFAQYKINRTYNGYQVGYHNPFGNFGQYR